MKPNNASTDTTKGRVTIYREAARIIEKENCEFTCWAISIAGGFEAEWDHQGYRPPVLMEYVETFAAREGELQNLFEDHDQDERRNLRILALCFMAAMVEAGDA